MARLNGYDWEKKGLEEALPQGVGGYRGERWQLDTDTKRNKHKLSIKPCMINLKSRNKIQIYHIWSFSLV